MEAYGHAKSLLFSQLGEDLSKEKYVVRSRPNTKPWLDTSNVMDSAPASTASLIFLVNETVSGVVDSFNSKKVTKK
jgi:hypothetical protein